MPKLGKYSPILNCVFYLYETKADAEVGAKSGGTGFLVSVPSTHRSGHVHVHGVTNWHVAVKPPRPCPCIRINTHSGKPAIFEFSSQDWTFISGKYDVAVSPPLKIQGSGHKASYLDINSFFLTPDQEREDEVGPAEDVFMVGRFIDYDGIEANDPAFRFGHISIMSAQISQATGFRGRSIILDMHSRSGFSGSPVFVFRTLGSHFIEQAPPGSVLTGGGHYMKLLGIHWGQFPELWELKNNLSESAIRESSLVTDGAYVNGLSGMTCVIPAVSIAEVLSRPELSAMRDESDHRSP
jgi:hypothetical protein